MAQVFSVCRMGSEWGFRDVTGARYAQSEDIIYVVEAAERMANRLGGRVELIGDAEYHYRSAKDAQLNHAEMQIPPRFGFRGLAWRFARWRKR